MKFAAAFFFLALASPGLPAEPAPAPEAPPARQIKIFSKVIQGPAAVIPPGATVDPETLEARLAEIAAKKGWDILSAPTVVTREGQKATVEIGREVLLDPAKDPVFAGISAGILARSTAGGAIQIDAHAVLTELSGEKGDTAPLLTFEQKLDIPVAPGHTVSLVIPTKDPGQFATFLLTPEWFVPEK